MAAMLPRKASSGVFWARRGVVQARVARTKRFMKLAPVDSNHHSQIQSLVSCRWTRGQRDGKNLHYDPVRRGSSGCCAPTPRLGSGVLAGPNLPRAVVAAAPQLRSPNWSCTVVSNTTRGGGAVNQQDGHKRSGALARLGE